MNYKLSHKFSFDEVIHKLHQNCLQKYQWAPESRFFENTCSNSILDLPQSIHTQAEKVISAFYEGFKSYLEVYEFTDPTELMIKNTKPKNHSVLMAYDFHLDEKGHLRLVEVNTNASGYPLVEMLYDVNQVPNVEDKNLSHLLSSFKYEQKLNKQTELTEVTIIDEEIEKQKMYPEFKIFQQWFENNSIKCTIKNFNELQFNEHSMTLVDQKQNQIDFIYNRYCDFLLAEPRSLQLLKAYEKNQITLSPHPKEYLMTADKNSLIRLSNQNLMEKLNLPNNIKELIQTSLIKTSPIRSITKEDLWTQRKRYFFKPSRSHGGKATYRGKTITKKAFDFIYENNFIFQEYVPAPLCSKESEEPWKFDLRFYTYKNKIQQSVARIYRGQVTNFKVKEGGFTPILWS